MSSSELSLPVEASYLDDPPPRGLFTRLARVALHLARLQQESVDPIALRFSDYTVLATLMKEQAGEGLPVSRLAELVLRPMGSITQIVDRLTRDGLVDRRLDPQDRRMVRIALSAEGEALARRGAAIYDEVHARVLEGVAAEEVERIDAAIRGLLELLERDQETAS